MPKKPHIWKYVPAELTIRPKPLKSKMQLTAYPTPLTPSPSTGSTEMLTSRQPLLSSPPSYRSPTVTSSTDGEPDPDASDGQEELERALWAQDMLRKHCPDDKDLPIPSICVLGAQKAGKSSALSALMNIELYSAARVATYGPTVIASRRTSEPFKASVKIVLLHPNGKIMKNVDFATGISQHTELASVLHLAAEEARRAEGPGKKVRDWETLKTMSEEELSEEYEASPSFTGNVVQVHISGHNCASVDLVDLPGLTGGDTGPTVKALVERYVMQPQNIILLCISDGGINPSSDDPAFQIVKPYADRTMGIITRADHFDPDLKNGSSFVQVILGQFANLGGFHPRLGWWPLRLRTQVEKDAKVDQRTVYAIQEQLFLEPKWRTLQEKAGREFGILPTRQFLEGVFAGMVKTNMVAVHRSLQKLMAANEAWIDQNPVDDDPIASLHGYIDEFSAQLTDGITFCNRLTTLYNLQHGLAGSVLKDMPIFVSSDEEDSESASELEQNEVFMFRMLDRVRELVKEGDTIHFNKFADLVAHLRSRRDHTILETDLVADFLKVYADKWKTSAIEHAASLWTEVDKIQNGVAQHVCGDKQAVTNSLLRHLAGLNQEAKAATLNFIDQMHIVALAPPSDVGFLSAPHPTIASDQSNLASRTDSSRVRFLLTGPSEADGIPSISQEVMTKKERDECLILQDKIAAAVRHNAQQFAEVVGVRAQVEVLNHVKRVVKRLRRDTGLLDVRDGVRKRTAEMMETDVAKTQERERRVKRQSKYAKVHAELSGVL